MLGRLLLVTALLICHAVLAWGLRHQRPAQEILPPVPSPLTAKAMAFGDDQFLYRAFALQLQNAGDTGGRTTPLRDYDMEHVVGWLDALQALDARAHFHTALAVRYFANTPEDDGVRRLIEFVRRDVDMAPDRKWPWYPEAVAMARHRLKDMGFALELSRKMRDYGKYLPVGYIWTLQIEPILLADLGRADEAAAVMDEITARYGHLMTPDDKAWTARFMLKLSQAH